jgi:hypothetical protein
MKVFATQKPRMTFGIKEDTTPTPKALSKPRVLKDETGRIQTPGDVKRTGKIKDVLRDAARKAMLPGKRLSKTGNVYYEYRRNRSDAFGKKI